ncbi:MAG: DUF4270 family protein [Bacteroidales bacterium]|nr:DUF4270 domain-containing protein [Bacteroidales bacterium]MDD2425027.1 DUF4270 family protein [Bacteroidales bacterium]MDD3989332.1 DUF4270 family protein [Bacteroidales bacterium]MDD4638690.1 DUF4270 family protein [Bacteroidales bacterium]
MIIRNLSANSLLFLSAILATLMISSCIDVDKSLGSDVVPGDFNLKVENMTIQVPVQMKMADSLQTIFPDYLIVGAYKDQELGTVTSDALFHFAPTIIKNDYGDNPAPISFKLYITVSQKLVLDASEESIPQNIYLYKLKKGVDSTTVYSNSLSVNDIESTPINLGTATYYGADTLNMNLSLDFAQEILSSTQQERDSTKLFAQRFKGFVITTEPLPGSLSGGRFNIIDPSKVYLELKYRHVEVDSLIDKDSLLYFYVPSDIPYMNRYSHSSSGLESATPQGKIMLEGLAGIKPYIDFEEVRRDMTLWAEDKGISPDRIVVAKAELRLPYEFPEEYTLMGQYPTQLFLSTRNNNSLFNNQPFYQPVSDINILTTGTNNRSKQYYSLNISSYIQKILTGKKTGKELKTWITPITQLSNSYTGEVSYLVDNVVYFKAKLNGNNDQRKPHLVMTYSVLP